MLLKDKLTFYQKYKQLSNWNDIFKENILKKKFVIERYTIKHNKYKEKANKITFLDWIQRQKNDTKKLSPASLWEPHKKDILAFRQWKLNSQTRKKLVATASPWWGRLQPNRWAEPDFLRKKRNKEAGIWLIFCRRQKISRSKANFAPTWWRRVDLNHRPPACQAGTLTSWATPSNWWRNYYSIYFTNNQ